MVKDRLKELVEKLNDSSFRSKADGGAGNAEDEVVIEMGWVDGDMTKYLDNIQDQRNTLLKISSEIERIKVLQVNLLNSPTRDKENETELDGLMNSVKVSCRNFMKTLKEIETIANKPKSELTLTRIQKIQYEALRKSFTDLLESYQQAQTEYHEKCKLRVKRMIAIRDSAEGRDNAAFESDDDAHIGNVSIFTEGYAAQMEGAKMELNLVEERNQDLLKVEKAIQDLHELFMEMAQLVTLQGEVIDNIEKNVNEAVSTTDGAKYQLAEAQKKQTSARKKKIIIIIVLIILAIVLGVILYVSFK